MGRAPHGTSCEAEGLREAEKAQRVSAKALPRDECSYHCLSAGPAARMKGCRGPILQGAGHTYGSSDSFRAVSCDRAGERCHFQLRVPAHPCLHYTLIKFP